MEALEYFLGLIPDILSIIRAIARLFGLTLPLLPSGD